jgi:alpha-1,6-mannosyltransferase
VDSSAARPRSRYALGSMVTTTPQTAAAKMRTRRAVAVSITGTLMVAIVAATPTSPFYPIHPQGGGPSGPLRLIADSVGLNGLGGGPIILVGLIAAITAGIGFLLLCREAWNGRLSMRMVIGLTLAFHALVLFLPLLFSRDVYSYSYYGRMVSTYHSNPYVMTPSDFRLNSLWGLTWPGWRATPSVYGPLFTWISTLVTTWIHSVNALIKTFQIIAVAASLTTVYVVGKLVDREWPRRAVFAVAVIGCNPVVIFQVVAAGHNDMLVALAVAVAAASLFARKELLGTLALTLGMLVKATAGVPLVLLIVVAVARAEPGERLRVLLKHLAIVAGLTAFFAAPFLNGKNPTLGLIEVAGHDSWLAPGQLIVQGIAGLGHIIGGNGLGGVGEMVGRLGVFAVLAVAMFLIARRMVRDPLNQTPTAQLAAWGWALLLVMLLSPVMLPWYICWILPLAWALPAVPRRATVFMCSALIAAQLATEPNRIPDYLRVKILLGHPVLIFALAWIVVSLWRRYKAHVAFDEEEDTPQIGDAFEAPIEEPLEPAVVAVGAGRLVSDGSRGADQLVVIPDTDDREAPYQA